MTDLKLSQLSAVTDVQDTDEFELARAGASKKITAEDLVAAAVAGLALQDAIFILGFATPAGQSNFDNVDPHTLNVVGTRFSDNTDGAWIEWTVALRAGTYSLMFGEYEYSGSGILVWSINGTDIDDAPYSASNAVEDTYASGSAYGPKVVTDDLTIPADGVYTLRATVTGKNASSSGFATNIIYVHMNQV